MKYDFVEIGTSDFDTLIEKATDETIGLSIEPLQEYLDNLPDKPKVKKLNFAISINEEDTEVDLYYVPKEEIINNKLVPWLRGCNRIGGMHPAHSRWGVTHLVKVVKVPCYPLSKILEDNDVTELDFLKIDTEGFDCKILGSFVEYLTNKDKSYWPKKIRFESNHLTLEETILETIAIYENLGYTAERILSDTHETILTLP